MINKYPNGDLRMAHPVNNWFEITQDTDVFHLTRYISIETSGQSEQLAIDIESDDGDRQTVKLTIGILHPIRVKRVHSLNTDAGVSKIIGWY